jgi:hypothetical protein
VCEGVYVGRKGKVKEDTKYSFHLPLTILELYHIIISFVEHQKQQQQTKYHYYYNFFWLYRKRSCSFLFLQVAIDYCSLCLYALASSFHPLQQMLKIFAVVILVLQTMTFVPSEFHFPWSVVVARHPSRSVMTTMTKQNRLVLIVNVFTK